jgi:hypothetical protein
LNDDGSALCPYCNHPMEESLGDTFPVEWVEERPSIEAD